MTFLACSTLRRPSASLASVRQFTTAALSKPRTTPAALTPRFRTVPTTLSGLRFANHPSAWRPSALPRRPYSTPGATPSTPPTGSPPQPNRPTSSSGPRRSPPRFVDPRGQQNTKFLLYSVAVIISLIGATYASVPLYRLFCSVTGVGGTPNTDTIRRNPEQLKPKDRSRPLRITFSASTSDTLHWSFIPQQREVHVVPGETALAFYTAKNLGEDDIIGVATYNVTPLKAGAYFNKLQCFCFEEQRLAAGEEVDMPVFFFIDPEFADDPLMRDVDTITLSYTFFKAKELGWVTAIPHSERPKPALPTAAQ
ncbi:Cytochrome c oxidase assembly protein cox11, mitochondrial [Tieghemiomyces parasiticus]|uniref:Cytochrome c oxidase assembly protein cox11, mitochondrial n=1 Tax=Tieghemiomyces parasiticus TaxID=78921 RepID=A0A9W8A2Q0_9FUNG|nr:Cytochrome c oxidase assembly protein cox11, mitochondrial [Tieghemiomyces parasiticus]